MKRFVMMGAGFWAKYQLAAWREIPGVECAAICDADLAKAQAFAKENNVSTAYADANEALDKIHPDFVDIVSSVPSHVPLVQLAIQKRIPAICQKPLAETWEDCLALAVASQNAGLPLFVHENWRWQAALSRVKVLLRQHAIGIPYRCRIDFASAFDVFANQPALKTMNHFVIADIGVHLLDLARSWFGEANQIYCRTRRVRPDISGEDVASISLVMNHGKTDVQINLAYAGTPIENDPFPHTLAFIEGECGSLRVGPHGEIRVTTTKGTETVSVQPRPYAWTDPKYAVVQASMVECQTNLLNALDSGADAETDVRDNLRTMQLVHLAYASAQRGEAMEVPSL